jgi:hypothetical protein
MVVEVKTDHVSEVIGSNPARILFQSSETTTDHFLSRSIANLIESRILIFTKGSAANCLRHVLLG